MPDDVGRFRGSAVAKAHDAFTCPHPLFDGRTTSVTEQVGVLFEEHNWLERGVPNRQSEQLDRAVRLLCRGRKRKYPAVRRQSAQSEFLNGC